MVTYCSITNHPKISSWKQNFIISHGSVCWNQLHRSSAGFSGGLSHAAIVRWWLGHNNVEAEGSIIWNTRNRFFTYISGFLYLVFISTSLRACPYFLSFQQDSLDHLYGGPGIPWTCARRVNLLMTPVWKSHSITSIAFYRSSRVRGHSSFQEMKLDNYFLIIKMAKKL